MSTRQAMEASRPQECCTRNGSSATQPAAVGHSSVSHAFSTLCAASIRAVRRQRWTCCCLHLKSLSFASGYGNAFRPREQLSFMQGVTEACICKAELSMSDSQQVASRLRDLMDKITQEPQAAVEADLPPKIPPASVSSSGSIAPIPDWGEEKRLSRPVAFEA